MSYPRTIEEIPEPELGAELMRRQDEREDGRCDFCHRRPDTTPCMFPDRHTDHRIEGMSPWCTTHDRPMLGVRGDGTWACTRRYELPPADGDCDLTFRFVPARDEEDRTREETTP